MVHLKFCIRSLDYITFFLWNAKEDILKNISTVLDTFDFHCVHKRKHRDIS